MSSSSKYFAGAERKSIGERLWARFDKCLSDPNDQRFLYANAYEHYYGLEAGAGITTGVTRKGEQGELAAVRINRSRVLARAFHALVTAAQVTWSPHARNGDAGAAKATTLSRNLLEDRWKQGRLARTYTKWTAEAIQFAHSFIFDEWDRGAGPPLVALKDRLVLQGDVTNHNVPPWRVHTDTSRGSWEEEDWFYVRLYKSRWSLAKLYTRLADGRQHADAEAAILDVKPDERIRMQLASDVEADAVPVVYFLHKPTPAMPAGRYTVMLSSDVVLQDVPLLHEYAGLPLHRLAFEDITDSPKAWSQFWDMLSAQELLDGIDTTLATILTTLGNPTVAYMKGSENHPDTLAQGFRTWEYPVNGRKPEPVQLAEFPPDALKYREAVEGNQQQIMGMSDVSLGQPQSAQMNAQAFAVLASMAVQNASPFQKEAIDALGRLGTSNLRTLRMHVRGERVVRIAGKQNRHLVSETRWQGKDLGSFEDVTVDVGSPLEQTAQGRLALVQLYQSMGFVTNMEEAQQVIETGRAEPAERAVRDELQLIRTEYEQLQNGEAPVVHRFDNHPLHYREHAAVLKTGEARREKAIVVAVEKHNAQHYEEYFGIHPDQDLLQPQRERFLLGFGPEPMPMPMDPAAAAPGAPGPVDGALPPPPGAPPELPVGPPAPPPNPMTGQPFDSATGGGIAPMPQ